MKAPEDMSRADLEAEVHYLRGELGLVHDQGKVWRLQSVHGITGAEARTLLALYRAKGRVMTVRQILDAVSPDGSSDVNSNNVAVWLSRVRKRVGDGWTASHWGRGYSMTTAGLAAVREALGDG